MHISYPLKFIKFFFKSVNNLNYFTYGCDWRDISHVDPNGILITTKKKYSSKPKQKDFV